MDLQPLSSPLSGRFQLNLPSAPRRPIDLVQEYKNFKRSAAPARFLHFHNGSWLEFESPVFDVLVQHFLAGRTAFEAVIDGICYLIDFLTMSQIDSDTGVANSIAWIDVKGHCFFPKVVVDGRNDGEPVSAQKLEIEIKLEDGVVPAVVCDSDEKTREPVVLQPENSEASMTACVDQPRWPGVMELSRNDRFFKAIEKIFLSEMRRFVPDVVITRICKCLHSGSRDSARLRAFQAQIQVMKSVRGDAGVKLGWYGASAMDLPAIIEYGFGQVNSRLLGSEAFGVGVHISAPQIPHLSSLLAEADEDGEKHLVLCRVIMGKSEIVEAGSQQFHPSSDEFDSGVDCIEKPKWYIVWSAGINTQILPECIVSFKSQQNKGSSYMVNKVRKPASSSLSFTKLIAELGRSLPSSMLHSVQISYNQFKGGKVNKDTFIKSLRSLVGDQLLTSSIRKIRGY